MDLDNEFGHWLAGFAAGEGCFTIGEVNVEKKYGGQFFCQFSIGLRDDDTLILREIAKRTGLGKLYTSRKPAVGQSGQLKWTVLTKRDCLRLVSIFDRFPLRAKKAADFVIWREAVVTWATIGHWRRNKNDWSLMAHLKAQLETGRKYVTSPVKFSIRKDHLQLHLVEEGDESRAERPPAIGGETATTTDGDRRALTGGKA